MHPSKGGAVRGCVCRCGAVGGSLGHWRHAKRDEGDHRRRFGAGTRAAGRAGAAEDAQGEARGIRTGTGAVLRTRTGHDQLPAGDVPEERIHGRERRRRKKQQREDENEERRKRERKLQRWRRSKPEKERWERDQNQQPCSRCQRNPIKWKNHHQCKTRTRVCWTGLLSIARTRRPAHAHGSTAARKPTPTTEKVQH